MTPTPPAAPKAPSPSAAVPISGLAEIVDGDTLKVAGTTIRLNLPALTEEVRAGRVAASVAARRLLDLEAGDPGHES